MRSRKFQRQYSSLLRLIVQFSVPIAIGITTFFLFGRIAVTYQTSAHEHTEQAVMGSNRNVRPLAFCLCEVHYCPSLSFLSGGHWELESLDCNH